MTTRTRPRLRCVCGKRPHLPGCPAWTPDHEQRTLAGATVMIRDGMIYAARMTTPAGALRWRAEETSLYEAPVLSDVEADIS